jgi:curved DNA-binding protein CbpA
LKDFYRILGVPENAHEQDIKLAYRRLAKRYHPDVNPGDIHAEERFKEITEAYNTLSDPLLKSAYDRKRQRRDLFSNSTTYFYSDPKTEKKDPRRKEYSQEDFDRARAQNRKRTLANMAKRKKLLRGMIITFILYLFAAAGFEHWMDLKNKKEAEDRRNYFDSLSAVNKKNNHTAIPAISNADSPYDSIFGTGVYWKFSPNHLVIYNPISDALICAVQLEKPFKTIRNEFTRADQTNTPLVLRELPNGSYYIKVYTGSDWDVNKKTPDGRRLGGFKKDEEFFRIDAGPFTLTKPSFEHPNTHTCDTVWIDPTITKMDRITREEFYSNGSK